MKKPIRKSIGGKRPGAGRPATGTDPVMAIRFPNELRAAVVKWAERQPGTPTLSHAVRRLVELGLTVKTPGKGNSAQKARAKELAGGAIDKMTDAKAAPDDQASRKRRLLKGPEEFRELRVDRPKRK